MKRVAFFIFAVVVWLAQTALAVDWPQFRGPDRDGVWNETNILQAFPDDGLKVAWRVTVGAGLSSPIVSGGRVFVCDSELKKPKAWEHVRCYDKNSGMPLWIHTNEAAYPDWAFDTNAPAGPDATPIANGGRVYALGRFGNLLCLDALDGTVQWQKNLGKDYGPVESLGTTPSPLIEGNLLILVIGGNPDGCVIALDKDSGKEIWRALGDKFTYSSPIMITAGGKRQLIVLTPEAVTSLDPLSGKAWWREKRETRGDYTAACPVQHQDLLFAGGIMFRLDREKPAALVLWPETSVNYTRRILSQTSVPLIRDGCVFSDKSYGHLVCLDVLTGKQLWQYDKLTDKANGAAQQFFPNGDSVLIFTNQGDLIRARLGPVGCQEISRIHVIDPTYLFAGRKCVWPLPAFANQHVFARNDRELICLSLAHEL